MTGSYLASEDSALLRSTLGRYSGRRSLEIGAGNGGNLIELSKGFETVVGTDVRRPGITDWKNLGISFLVGDLATSLCDESFDLVAFNPPYLAVGGGGDDTVEGGSGLEVPLKFLREGLRTVKKTGRIVMLLNDEADTVDFERECSEKGFTLRKIAEKHLFYETIAVYQASSDSIRRRSSD
jgi:release factor glutamine methyltransferase